ncbi:endolytic transglycosylase MltG [Legionella sp. CNM-4043-24]|uniref:endolytic transglycosylase MltG n=1 Tax=Legionella sp. CNM-4043-24 TaxID=3421646 RepID=UPI00403A872A
MSISRFKWPLLILVLLAVILSLQPVWRGFIFLHRPMFESGEPVIIEVKPNSSASTLANTLYEKKLISSQRMFLYFIKWTGSAGHLKAGVYQVLPGQSVQNVIDRIVAGDVLKLPFRIIEGSNLTQVISNLQGAPWLNYNASDWTFLPLQYRSAEGLLLADTYSYNAGTDARSLLKNANSQLLQELEKNWNDRSADLPYKTSYEMLIVASILEKEASLPAERALISGVVLNRLQKNMPLQMDPTVIYALGTAYNGKLHHRDLSIDSPYNTYRYRGLPPTPIAMVGKGSLYAAAHPQKSKYLYFVAKGDGTHIFSETYAEQREAIARYLSGNH